MLAIARALVANPSCSSWTNRPRGLHRRSSAEVGRLIGQLRQEGTSVLLVEQSAAFAVQVSDYAHVMSQGAIVHCVGARGALGERRDQDASISACRRQDGGLKTACTRRR